MKETSEIAALFHLIDDPDKEVYTTVSERIISFGKPIIPNLEHLWENTPDEKVQGRIEILIHHLHYRDLKTELDEWSQKPEHDLLTGTLLVSRYMYPEMAITPVLQEMEKLRRMIWLELNDYLTSLEKINVVTTILYKYHSLLGTDINPSQPDTFLVDKAIDTKRGNMIANGILYVCLCEMLDLPIKVLNVPGQFVLAYLKEEINIEETEGSLIEHILFYVDPLSGTPFTRTEMVKYLKRVNAPFEKIPSYFIPMNNKSIIRFQLEELARCFDDDKNKYKQEELLQLATILT